MQFSGDDLQHPECRLILSLRAFLTRGFFLISFFATHTCVHTCTGLFKDQFVDQVQVVGYLHEFEPATDRDGAFVYWTDNKEVELISPLCPRSSVSVKLE